MKLPLTPTLSLEGEGEEAAIVLKIGQFRSLAMRSPENPLSLEGEGWGEGERSTSGVAQMNPVELSVGPTLDLLPLNGRFFHISTRKLEQGARGHALVCTARTFANLSISALLWAELSANLKKPG